MGCEKRKGEVEHPQPHWHWGYTEEHKSDHFEASETSVVPFMETEEQIVPSLPVIDFEELHYAMAAKWVSHDTAVEEFKPQNLYDWMKRCIGCVLVQYNYQINKERFVTSHWW